MNCLRSVQHSMTRSDWVFFSISNKISNTPSVANKMQVYQTYSQTSGEYCYNLYGSVQFDCVHYMVKATIANKTKDKDKRTHRFNKLETEWNRIGDGGDDENQKPTFAPFIFHSDGDIQMGWRRKSTKKSSKPQKYTLFVSDQMGKLVVWSNLIGCAVPSPMGFLVFLFDFDIVQLQLNRPAE